MVEDAGRGWRRVVGSPQPREIVELDSIRELLDAGTIVVAAGGGGIPVARGAGVDSASLVGVEAVIDKDRTAALLAHELGAQRLVILTAVDCVFRDFGTDHTEPIGDMTVTEARDLLAKGSFPAGSMAPKVEAAALFAENTGRRALITSDAALTEALAGRAGTWIAAE